MSVLRSCSPPPASLGVIQNIPVFADLVLLETYSFPGQGKGNTSTELFVRTIYNSTVVQACDALYVRGLAFGVHGMACATDSCV
jgi:hypothetical protein